MQKNSGSDLNIGLNIWEKLRKRLYRPKSVDKFRKRLKYSLRIRKNSKAANTFRLKKKSKQHMKIV